MVHLILDPNTFRNRELQEHRQSHLQSHMYHQVPPSHPRAGLPPQAPYRQKESLNNLVTLLRPLFHPHGELLRKRPFATPVGSQANIQPTPIIPLPRGLQPLVDFLPHRILPVSPRYRQQVHFHPW